ncbi:uncharacterized protein LOC121776030 [Salvia splendens]|uniref:uncharacterized protein LOC121776030 n=1 Tax=Salvia splendens TaxID=180675 RepID=UPI001C25FDF7|nr:uncharacterized protein LOC121776030 [Salvia splendens]
MQSLQEPSSAESESAADSDNGGGFGKDAIEKGRRESSVSQCCVEIVDLEGEGVAKTGRDCRICHLSMDATNQDSGLSMELGCSCKEDLGAAHKQCAEAWFKIKGDNLSCRRDSASRDFSFISFIVSGILIRELPLSPLHKMWSEWLSPSRRSHGTGLVILQQLRCGTSGNAAGF